MFLNKWVTEVTVKVVQKNSEYLAFLKRLDVSIFSFNSANLGYEIL